MALPPHVEKFVAGALEETSKSGGIAQRVRKVLDFLQTEGLVYSQRIHCSAIGVHNMNRDGLGVSWADSHRLVSEISQLGFVPEECKPVCVELKSDDTVVRSFNHQLQEEAGGKLRDPSSTAWIRFASLSCSHTNFAMRIVSENVEHSDPDVTMGGRLTVDRLSAKDPGFAKAVREGLDWTVVSARVPRTMWTHSGCWERLRANCPAGVRRADDSKDPQHGQGEGCCELGGYQAVHPPHKATEWICGSENVRLCGQVSGPTGRMAC